MATLTKGNSTKEKLLESATDLMLVHGYGATSIDEVCEKAKVNRGSFFYYFKSKEELGKELIDHFAAIHDHVVAFLPGIDHMIDIATREFEPSDLVAVTMAWYYTKTGGQ